MTTSDPNVNIRELIARIDERTTTLLESHKELKRTVEVQADSIKLDIEKHYTKKSDFEPVRKLVFGFVGFILLSVGGMFVGLLVRSNNASSTEPAIIKSISPSVPTAVMPQSQGK